MRIGAQVLVLGGLVAGLGCGLFEPRQTTPPLLIVEASVVSASDTVSFRVVNETEDPVSFNSCASTVAQRMIEGSWADVSVNGFTGVCAAGGVTLRGPGAESYGTFVLKADTPAGEYRLRMAAMLNGKEEVMATSGSFRVE